MASLTESAPAEPGAIGRGAATYALALLFLANLLNYADRSLLGIVVEPIRRELALNDTQISLLSGFAFVLFNLVAGLAFARWVDRGNRRLILAGGVALWSLATAATGLGHGFAALAACRMLVGVGEAVVFPAAVSLLADFYGGVRMPRAVSIFQASSGVGVVVGSVLAGKLAAAHGWRAMFAICGVAGFALVLVIATTLRNPPRTDTGDHRRTPQAGLGAALRTLWRLPGFAPLAFGYGASTMMLAVLPTWAPAFLLRSHGVQLANVGAVIGPAAVVGGIAGTIFAGALATRLIARTGTRCAGLTVPIAALPFAVPAFALFLFAPTIPVVIVAIALMNFLLSSSLGPCVALAVATVPATMRGLTSTVMLIVQGMLGFGLAPLIVGVASDALAPALGGEALRYALTIMLAAPLLAAGALWIARRHFAAAG